MNIGKETELIEFKKSTAELKEGIISLTSMLNKSGKGTLYFGVSNNGDVIGQQVGSDTERKISEAIAQSIEPAIIPTIMLLSSPEGLDYIQIKVEGVDSPYSAYGLYYCRSADQDKKATRESLKKMFIGSGFDFIRESNALVQELKFTQLFTLFLANGYHITNEKSFVKNIGLLTNDEKYNQMASLLSDTNPLPLKVVRFNGTDKTFLSQRTEYGNRCMILAMQQVMEYIQSIIETNVEIKDSQRKSTPLFDYDSFREAWVNACLHNAWIDLTPPAIYIFTDRIEIASYGGLPFGLSIDGFYHGETHPINKALQSIFIQLNYAEQTGHGVPIIVKNYGTDVFKISDNYITVTIPFSFEPQWAKAIRQDNPANELNQTQLSIIQYLKTNPDATLEDVASNLKLSVSSIKKGTSKLVQEGYLERRGSKRQGKWFVK